MAATLESLDELKTWDDYRLFMKERLKQVPTEDCPFFISKDKIEFSVNGKPWKGYAVLAGPKGLLAVKKIKKEGVLFREGVSRLDGKEFRVKGIQPTLLKHAHLTLKKLQLGYSIAGGEKDDADTDSGDADAVHERLAALTAEIKTAATQKIAAMAPLLKEAAIRAGQVGKIVATDAVRATALLKQGEDFLKQALATTTGDAGPSAEATELDERRKDVVQSIRDAAALREAANQAVLKQAATKIKEVETALAKNDLKAGEKGLDEIEDLLTEVVEGPEPADSADPDLAGLSDWKAYREFTKVQLKRMPKEGGPFYVTRKKVEFSIEGKPYKNYAVLVGKESKLKPTVQALKKEGTPCFEGTCVPEGMTIKVNGIKPEVLKGAVKLFMKLRLGRKIVAGEAPAGEGAQGGAAGEQATLRTIRAVATAWQAASSSVDQQIEGLRKVLKASDDVELAEIADAGLPDMKHAPQRPLTDSLKTLVRATGPARNTAIAAARKAINDLNSYIEQDSRIAACDDNPFGVQMSIRGTLAPALAKLDQGLASIAEG